MLLVESGEAAAHLPGTSGEILLCKFAAVGAALLLEAGERLPFGILVPTSTHMAFAVAPITGEPPLLAGAISEAEGQAAFRAVRTLFERWGLTDEQAAVLLDLALRTYRRWKADGPPRLGRDTKARLSNLLGIHKALRILFADPARGYAWVKADNEAFGGASALQVMLGGELTDLMRVRRYLDAERGGW
jgi:hypothetical protein